MAREIGCSRSVINRIENMSGLPHMAAVAAICNAYGLSWSDLLGDPADHKL
jgi:transcriptional regulator with XRE-family HTH domain